MFYFKASNGDWQEEKMGGKGIVCDMGHESHNHIPDSIAAQKHISLLLFICRTQILIIQSTHKTRNLLMSLSK